ncbi:hypothetical protein BOO86_18370 [Mycobacterium sp. CBMA 234]|nr:hypothetical protein [Mycolicibacterium sp. CBMA 234]
MHETADEFAYVADTSDSDYELVVSEPEEADDPEIPVAFAANTSGTVTVAAHLNGSVAQVSLAPTATGLSEHQLAQEIRAVADVAAKKATAVIHVMAVQSLVEQGLDFDEARELIANTAFTSPEDARAAEIDLANRDIDHH